jgi:hypothetical protein
MSDPAQEIPKLFSPLQLVGQKDGETGDVEVNCESSERAGTTST